MASDMVLGRLILDVPWPLLLSFLSTFTLSLALISNTTVSFSLVIRPTRLVTTGPRVSRYNHGVGREIS